MSEQTGFTIGSLAEQAGVNVETIRYYQRRGLVPESERSRGSIRRYGDAELARLRFIKSAQRLGFSLDEIAELLTLDDGARCHDARELAQRKLDDVRRRLDDLQRMASLLEGLVRQCGTSRARVSCPLIDALQGR